MKHSILAILLALSSSVYAEDIVNEISAMGIDNQTIILN